MTEVYHAEEKMQQKKEERRETLFLWDINRPDMPF